MFGPFYALNLLKGSVSPNMKKKESTTQRQGKKDKPAEMQTFRLFAVLILLTFIFVYIVRNIQAGGQVAPGKSLQMLEIKAGK